MFTLKDIIQKRKQKTSTDPQAFFSLTVEQVVRDYLKEHWDDITEKLNKSTEKLVEKLVKEGLKGEKGEKGDSIQGLPGRNADDLETIVKMAVPLVLAQIKIPKVKDGKSIKGDAGYTPVPGKDYLSPEQTKDLAIMAAESYFRDLPEEEEETPDEIAAKLLNSSKLIPIEKISGLKELLSNLGRRRGGGGGSGNRIHQHTAVSSATTTVSTVNKIAGAGFDLIVFYNGQMIARGTDYTVGSDFKTITLSFTPSDSTVLDIVYTRG